MRPLPLHVRSREPLVYVEHCILKSEEGRLVSESSGGPPVPIPIGTVVALMAGPGCTVTSAAASLAARSQTPIVYVGEGGVRFYCAGKPFGASGDVAAHHAQRWANEPGVAVRILFEKRWGVLPKGARAAEVRGEEGVLMRTLYRDLAKRHGVPWEGRRRGTFGGGDTTNDALSWGGACANALAAAVVHAAGAIPALGFLHQGGSFSFVYDVADLIRNDVTELVFSLVADGKSSGRDIRRACRDLFRQRDVAEGLISDVLDVTGRPQ